MTPQTTKSPLTTAALLAGVEKELTTHYAFWQPQIDTYFRLIRQKEDLMRRYSRELTEGVAVEKPMELKQNLKKAS